MLIPPFCGIISAVAAIDTSGLEAVFELRRRLEKQSLQVRILTENKIIPMKDKHTNICQTLVQIACAGESCGDCDGKATQIQDH